MAAEVFKDQEIYVVLAKVRLPDEVTEEMVIISSENEQSH